MFYKDLLDLINAMSQSNIVFSYKIKEKVSAQDPQAQVLRTREIYLLQSDRGQRSGKRQEIEEVAEGEGNQEKRAGVFFPEGQRFASG